MQQILSHGTRAVCISSDDGRRYTATLYVNCDEDARSPMQLGDITLLTAKRRSLKGAQRWAAKTLAPKDGR